MYGEPLSGNMTRCAIVMGSNGLTSPGLRVSTERLRGPGVSSTESQWKESCVATFHYEEVDGHRHGR